MSITHSETAASLCENPDFQASFSQGFFVLDFWLYPEAITSDYKYILRFRPSTYGDNPTYELDTYKPSDMPLETIEEEIEGRQLWKMMLSHHLFQTGATGEWFIPRQFQKKLANPADIPSFFEEIQSLRATEWYKAEIERIISTM
jgi:hypothetical protein